MIILDRLGDEIGVSVRYSVKARRVSIKIYYNGVELLLPNDCALNIGAKFLFAKEVWIRKKLQEQENRPLAADGTKAIKATALTSLTTSLTHVVGKHNRNTGITGP